VVRSDRRLKVVGQGASTRVRLVGDWAHQPLVGVRGVRGVERALEKVLRDQVGRARASGCSWTEIGEALGTSKQAAWERFSEA
jgi:hypothetical protein